jgi:hypothetical protein
MNLYFLKYFYNFSLPLPTGIVELKPLTYEDDDDDDYARVIQL